MPTEFNCALDTWTRNILNATLVYKSTANRGVLCNYVINSFSSINRNISVILITWFVFCFYNYNGNRIFYVYLRYRTSFYKFKFSWWSICVTAIWKQSLYLPRYLSLLPIYTIQNQSFFLLATLYS